jgi:hypothetical protein
MKEIIFKCFLINDIRQLVELKEYIIQKTLKLHHRNNKCL